MTTTLSVNICTKCNRAFYTQNEYISHINNRCNGDLHMSQSVILSSINNLTQAKMILVSIGAEMCVKCSRIFQDSKIWSTHSLRCNGDLNMSSQIILSFVKNYRK